MVREVERLEAELQLMALGELEVLVHREVQPDDARSIHRAAAHVAERAGLIENTRGTVRILNRKRLEDAACECYGVIQNYLGNLRLE